MSTAYPHEHSHAPSACPVEPHYPMQEQQYKDHSPTSSYPPRSEAFHHETFDIDPAQVQYNSHPLYQRPGIQDLDGAESVFDGPSVQGGSRMMPVQNGLNQRLSMDGQPRNGDMASMGPATPMSPQAAAALESLVACGGVEGLFKRFSLSQGLFTSLLHRYRPSETNCINSNPRDGNESDSPRITKGFLSEPCQSHDARSVSERTKSSIIYRSRVGLLQDFVCERRQQPPTGGHNAGHEHCLRLQPKRAQVASAQSSTDAAKWSFQ